MTSPCLNPQSLEHRPSWPKQQKQQLTLALSSVHQRQSIWLWIAILSQPFKSMEIQSTMYQILDTLVPWWHLAQVTSKGESHLLVMHSGSWNNFGRVHTYPMQQKSSCLIILVSLYYSMAVNRGWSPRIWKQNQRLCYLMLQSHAEYKAHWPCSEHHRLFHDQHCASDSSG